MSEPLTPSQLEELRGELTSDLARLERLVARARGEGAVMLDQTAVGRLSRMDALMNQGLAQASEARSETELALVKDALGRMDQGTYGRCLECESIVPYDRLMVMPETRTCARCGRG
jgi:DnaK suppressor protein